MGPNYTEWNHSFRARARRYVKFNELDVLKFSFSQTSQIYSSKIFKQRANITSSTEHPADQRPLWGRTGTGQALGGPSSASWNSGPISPPLEGTWPPKDTQRHNGVIWAPGKTPAGWKYGKSQRHSKDRHSERGQWNHAGWPASSRGGIAQRRPSWAPALPWVVARRILSAPEKPPICCQKVEKEPNNAKNVGKNISGRRDSQSGCLRGGGVVLMEELKRQWCTKERRMLSYDPDVSTVLHQSYTFFLLLRHGPSKCLFFHHWNPVFLFFSVLFCPPLRSTQGNSHILAWW